jgi:hypothetical protein
VHETIVYVRSANRMVDSRKMKFIVAQVTRWIPSDAGVNSGDRHREIERNITGYGKERDTVEDRGIETQQTIRGG